MKIINCFLLFSFLFLMACQHKKVKEIQPAFYQWSSSSFYDYKDEIKKMNVKKFYYKIFEVDYNEVRGNFPYAKNDPDLYDFKDFDSVEIVPTVFVKNEIFKHNNQKQLDELADNVVFLINRKLSFVASNSFIVFDEIQIDCDWTKSTKDTYFYFLKKVKEISKKRLSCTLRLYPYAYPKIMGVPPVDRAMLMCYNLLNPLENPDKNSILDVVELEKYLKNKPVYPLKLDVALPVFSWVQHYRNNQFKSFLNMSSREVVGLAQRTDLNWYTVTKDTTINWYTRLQAGDRIKYEDVSFEELQKATQLLKKYIPLENKMTISLFDLQTSIFDQYSYEEFTAIYSAFTK